MAELSRLRLLHRSVAESLWGKGVSRVRGNFRFEKYVWIRFVCVIRPPMEVTVAEKVDTKVGEIFLFVFACLRIFSPGGKDVFCAGAFSLARSLGAQRIVGNSRSRCNGVGKNESASV